MGLFEQGKHGFDLEFELIDFLFEFLLFEEDVTVGHLETVAVILVDLFALLSGKQSETANVSEGVVLCEQLLYLVVHALELDFDGFAEFLFGFGLFELQSFLPVGYAESLNVF